MKRRRWRFTSFSRFTPYCFHIRVSMYHVCVYMCICVFLRARFSRVCVHVQTERHHGDLSFSLSFILSALPTERESSPSTFYPFSLPSFLTLFSLPPCSSSFFLSSSPVPSLLHGVSSARLDEKSEYATIFKWQLRDTLLNALFASPPTSLPPLVRPRFLSPARSLTVLDHRSRVLFGRRPDRDEHVARCLIKNSPAKPSRRCDSGALHFRAGAEGIRIEIVFLSKPFH